jgi:phospholipid-binding lipoprotein MlaA
VSVNKAKNQARINVLRAAKIAAPGLLLSALLAGCATAPPASDTAGYQAFEQQNDPIEPTNRVFYKINDVLDTYAMKPVAQGYVDITTVGIRNHVTNFVTNIGEPARLLNFMAEGKPRSAGTSLVRFVLDSTVGIGGIFDPASALGYHELDTDFGITLAIWGVPPGPYLYLPAFGPSGVRDAMNIPVEYFATPMEAAPASDALTYFTWSETALHLVNTRAEYIQPIDQVKATALDPYATFRSLYRQSRDSQVQQIEAADIRTPPDWTVQPSQ